MAGESTFLHTIAVDSKGNIIAGETIRGRRVQRLKLMGYQRQKWSRPVKEGRPGPTAGPEQVP